MTGKRIQRIVKQWKEEAGVTHVIQWTYKDGILTLYTAQPGFLIGKGGVLVDKYKEIFKQELGMCFEKIDMIETAWLWA